MKMNPSILNKFEDTLEGFLKQPGSRINVSNSERLVSTGAGAFITLRGLSNLFSKPMLALTELGIGSILLYRGITGYCPIKEQLEKDNTVQENTTPLSE